jgi:hypothetical protein
MNLAKVFSPTSGLVPAKHFLASDRSDRAALSKAPIPLRQRIATFFARRERLAIVRDRVPCTGTQKRYAGRHSIGRQRPVHRLGKGRPRLKEFAARQGLTIPGQLQKRMFPGNIGSRSSPKDGLVPIARQGAPRPDHPIRPGGGDSQAVDEQAALSFNQKKRQFVFSCLLHGPPDAIFFRTESDLTSAW